MTHCLAETRKSIALCVPSVENNVEYSKCNVEISKIKNENDNIQNGKLATQVPDTTNKKKQHTVNNSYL